MLYNLVEGQKIAMVFLPYFYDYEVNVACNSGKIYSWEDNKWITPETKNKKSFLIG